MMDKPYLRVDEPYTWVRSRSYFQAKESRTSLITRYIADMLTAQSGSALNQSSTKAVGGAGGVESAPQRPLPFDRC